MYPPGEGGRFVIVTLMSALVSASMKPSIMAKSGSCSASPSASVAAALQVTLAVVRAPVSSTSAIGPPLAPFAAFQFGRATTPARPGVAIGERSEEHTSELQSHVNLVCRLLLEKKKNDRAMICTRQRPIRQSM